LPQADLLPVGLFLAEVRGLDKAMLDRPEISDASLVDQAISNLLGAGMNVLHCPVLTGEAISSQADG